MRCKLLLDTVLNPGLKAECLCSGLNYDCWFINKQMLTLKKAVWWEERIHYWLVQKFGLWHLYKFETIQAKPSFLLPNQEEDKRRLCLLGVIHSTNLRFFRNFGTSYSTRHKSWNTCVIFLSPMLIWDCSHLSAPKYAWLNIGEGEGHIWARTKVWRVNVRNCEKIQDKWLLFQRFVMSIVDCMEWSSPTHGEVIQAGPF